VYIICLSSALDAFLNLGSSTSIFAYIFRLIILVAALIYPVKVWIEIFYYYNLYKAALPLMTEEKAKAPKLRGEELQESNWETNPVRYRTNKVNHLRSDGNVPFKN
jgi:hypothetical protein